MGDVIAFPSGRSVRPVEQDERGVIERHSIEHRFVDWRAVDHDAPDDRAATPPVTRPTSSGPDDLPRRELLWREIAGHELRQERLRQGRTQSDVADRAGVSTQYLSEIERGRKEPSSEVLRAVMGALGLDLLDLTNRVTRTLAASAPVTSAPSASPVLRAG